MCKKILICGGGTGIISQYVVRVYKNMGYMVTAFNRGNKKKLFLDGVEYIEVDVNDRECLKKALQNRYFDIAIDFFTFTPDEMNNKLDLIAPKCDRYVFISSIAVYDTTKEKNVYKEADEKFNPEWSYGYNKSLCEDIVMSYYKQYQNGSYTIVRPGFTYSELMIPYPFMKSCNGQGYLPHLLLMGKPVAVLETDYYQIMHAEDFSNNLFLLLDNKEASYNEIYNITGDEMVSSYFIIMTLSMFMKIPVNIVCVNETYVEKFFDSRNYAELLSSVNCFLGHCYSNSKIKQVISYHSNIRICEKCNEIIEYFCKYQEYIMWDKINEIKIEEMLRLYIAGGGNVRILNNQIDQYASCVLQMYRNLYNRIETSINMMNKEIVNKEYLGKWLENKIKMSERISDKLKRMGITDVCIYGYGILGKLLLQELLKDGIQVKAIIDKQLYHLKEIKDIPIEKNVEGHETDCIIVSVMTDYENIYSYLLEHNCKKIISLNQLLLKKEEILDDNATY